LRFVHTTHSFGSVTFGLYWFTFGSFTFRLRFAHLSRGWFTPARSVTVHHFHAARIAHACAHHHHTHCTFTTPPLPPPRGLHVCSFVVYAFSSSRVHVRLDRTVRLRRVGSLVLTWFIFTTNSRTRWVTSTPAHTAHTHLRHFATIGSSLVYVPRGSARSLHAFSFAGYAVYRFTAGSHKFAVLRFQARFYSLRTCCVHCCTTFLVLARLVLLSFIYAHAPPLLHTAHTFHCTPPSAHTTFRLSQVLVRYVYYTALVRFLVACSLRSFACAFYTHCGFTHAPALHYFLLHTLPARLHIFTTLVGLVQFLCTHFYSLLVHHSLPHSFQFTFCVCSHCWFSYAGCRLVTLFRWFTAHRVRFTYMVAVHVYATLARFTPAFVGSTHGTKHQHLRITSALSALRCLLLHAPLPRAPFALPHTHSRTCALPTFCARTLHRAPLIIFKRVFVHWVFARPFHAVSFVLVCGWV